MGGLATPINKKMEKLRSGRKKVFEILSMEDKTGISLNGHAVGCYCYDVCARMQKQRDLAYWAQPLPSWSEFNNRSGRIEYFGTDRMNADVIRVIHREYLQYE